MNNYDVHVPRFASRLSPSKTQSRILTDISAGAKLIGRFDVYGGYDWVLRHPNGMVGRVTRATVQGLLDRKLITKGEAVSVSSGYQETIFTKKEALP